MKGINIDVSFNIRETEEIDTSKILHYNIPRQAMEFNEAAR